MLAPAKTPPIITKRLAAATEKITTAPDITEKLICFSQFPQLISTDDLGLRIRCSRFAHKAIAEIETEVGRGLESFRHAARLLSTMSGVNALVANVIVAEIGIDMSRFATPAHLRFWACICLRNDESAGKRCSTRLRRGGKWLKKAIIAVAASMLTAVWHMLRDSVQWHDLGASHFDRADAQKTANRLIRRLQQKGYTVNATPA